MKQPICPYCQKPVTGAMIGTGDGYAHSHCYTRANPPTPATSLYIVARGGADPVLAAEVIAEVVDPDTASKIVREFNRKLLEQWLRRCQLDT